MPLVSAQLKKVIRNVLTIKPANQLAVAVARMLPGENWKKRLPVVRQSVAFNMDQAMPVLLGRPDVCQVAQEVFWAGGTLDTPQDRNAISAAIAFSRQAKTFLDIGSYTGLFALAAARANPGLRADAYEIVGENFLILWENVLRNDLADRVFPNLVGIGPKEGEMKTPFAMGMGSLASSVSLDWQFENGIRVPVRTLDELYADVEGPIAMKIDVEGFEMEIFDGAHDFMNRHKPDVVCEILRRAKRVDEMEQFLLSLGYRWFHIREDGFARRDKIVADKWRRDWLLTTKCDQQLADLGLRIVD